MDSQPTFRKREKVPLKPGFLLVDWYALVATGEDLAGFNKRKIKVPEEEVAKHNTEDDLWVILHGNVYNVTRYKDYHPGGVAKLMLRAGQDCTDLFDSYHKWVNYEKLLSTSLIGPVEWASKPEKMDAMD